MTESNTTPATSTGFRYERSETGNAEAFRDKYGGIFKHCAVDNVDYIFDGVAHNEAKKQEPTQLMLDAIRGRIAEELAFIPNDPKEYAALMSFARKSESAAGIANPLRIARSMPEIAVATEDLDRSRVLFNCQNATLDLSAKHFQNEAPAPGAAREQCAEDLITHVAPVDYDPDAECPLWDAFQDRICAGDQDLIEYKRQFYFYCLTGLIHHQIFTIQAGDGANGKSVETDTIMGLMGALAIEAPDSLLTVSFGDQHPTEVMDLIRRRMVVASETEVSKKLRIGMVKRMTGNVTLKGLKMRQDFVEFPVTHKTILQTNHKPLIPDNGNAIWRRVRVIPYPVTIPVEEQDPHLIEKLKREYPGILNWILRGGHGFYKPKSQGGGLAMPDCMKAATAAYREDQDTFGRFVEECCELGEDAKADPHRTHTADLFSVYTQWARDNVSHPLGVKRFREELLRLDGLESDKFRWPDTRYAANRHGFRGIKLAADSGFLP